MPVGELYDRMSLHELTVCWPLFIDYENRMRAQAQDEAEREADRARRRIG